VLLEPKFGIGDVVESISTGTKGTVVSAYFEYAIVEWVYILILERQSSYQVFLKTRAWTVQESRVRLYETADRGQTCN